MQCELNKPVCKRKLMFKEGPFEKKKSCPLTQKRQCPLATPQCPLLPKQKNNCPISKLIGNENESQKCPLAQPACPCDPTPPCPLAYEIDEKRKDKSQKTKNRQISCPANYPVYSKFSKSTNENDTNMIATPCPNVLKPKRKKLEPLSMDNKNESQSSSSSPSSMEEPAISVSTKKGKSKQRSEKYKDPENRSEKKTAKKRDKVKKSERYKITKKNLTVPDCTLSSSRPFPCSKCLGDLLTTPENLAQCAEDCPYLKIMNICDNECLCRDVPSVDSGPPCPFAPKPCPCCAVIRCPLTRVPDCPLVTKEIPKRIEPPSCKCYCPIIPPPCSLNIPPQCPMHNNSGNSASCPLQSSKCKCNQQPKCPLVPDSYSSCPLQTSYQTEASDNLKPIPNSQSKPETSEIPSLLVPQSVFSSLNDTLNELNKLCTCKVPPPPQMVNIIPINSLPEQCQPCCTAAGDHIDCPIECPCEPPRTFHVPTCPKGNPPGLRSFPKSKNNGELVCPFSPKCCPLGPKCPFPVAARTEESNQNKEQNKPFQSFANERNIPDRNIIPRKPSSSNVVKTQLVEFNKCEIMAKSKTDESQVNINDQINEMNLSKLSNEIPVKENNLAEHLKKINVNNKSETLDTSTSSGCPLSNIPGGKKKCPFAPAPCPLDPIKPLLIKEPKVCPFAPEPACPLMPKPLCPPTPRCLIKPAAPLPECPYAPPGCPLAPKKTCFSENTKNYECPCPKPEPCPCSEPGPKCLCPKPEESCPCPRKATSCPCDKPDSNCPCDKPDSSCPCDKPDSSCPCDKPDSSCPCDEPELTCQCPKPELVCPCKPNPGCPCPQKSNCLDQTQLCECPIPIQILCSCQDQTESCPLTSKPKYNLAPLLDSNCPLADENSKKNNVINVETSKTGKDMENGTLTTTTSKTGKDMENGTLTTTTSKTGKETENIPLTTKTFKTGKEMKSSPVTTTKLETVTENKCVCSNLNSLGECSCPKEKESNCPCTKASGKPCCHCKKPTEPPDLDPIIDELKKSPKELHCPVKIPACEKFPEGRCPMEDLGVCDCDYPCAPCLERPQCDTVQAPPQYCLKQNCCMGLSLPPVTSENWKDTNGKKTLYYYKFAPTKPGREETKYYVEILDHPPNNHPLGLPKERENPKWYVVKHGTSYEKCKDVAAKLKNRKPSADGSAQFNPKDNPIDAETKMVVENREHLAKQQGMIT